MVLPSLAHFIRVLRPRVLITTFCLLPLTGLIMVRFCKFGIWRRLVFWLLWLTLLPVNGILPVTAQTFDIIEDYWLAEIWPNCTRKVIFWQGLGIRCYTTLSMGEKQGDTGIAHVVAVNMGYGHERPAHALRCLAVGGEVIIANDYPGIPDEDKALWHTTQTWYERISRLNALPIIGPAAFKLFDQIQHIPEFYPRRDLSAPSLEVRELAMIIRNRGFLKHLIDDLAHNPKPLITTYFAVAMAAEEFAYPADIFLLVTDADMNRVWAPVHPKKSRIKYFAPTGRVAERLKLYGVRESHIYLTGYPLPREAIGGLEPTTLKVDLARRLCNLDPRGVFSEHAMLMLEATLGAKTCRRVNGRATTISLTFAIGGAGAQREIGIIIAKSLSQDILDGRISLNLVAGTRPEVAEYFRVELMKLGLASALKSGGVRIILAESRAAYFAAFTRLMQETDILWTKPSELAFYTGLGIPIIIAPTIGSQEDFNRRWLTQIGGGIDQLDPRYTHEWLFDWINGGALARAAWLGFIDAPTHGAYRIEDIVLGRPNSIHALPSVI